MVCFVGYGCVDGLDEVCVVVWCEVDGDFCGWCDCVGDFDVECDFVVWVVWFVGWCIVVGVDVYVDEFGWCCDVEFVEILLDVGCVIVVVEFDDCDVLFGVVVGWKVV